jgi:hypothetical protein
MKTLKLIFFLLLSLPWIGNAQTKAGFGFFTDRDFYVSGESVLAKLYIPEDIKTRIIHLDLIHPSGKQINAVSLELKNHEANGYFHLPDSLSSGTYLLRAYWSVSGESSKMIRELWITNRFSSAEVPEKIQRMKGYSPSSVAETSQVKFSGIQAEMTTNKEIQTMIQLDESLLQSVKGNLLISVAQSVSELKSATYQFDSKNGHDSLGEEKGIIRTGLVTDRKTNLPVADATVYLTIPDSVPGFQYYVTGSDGRFYFLIDRHYGTLPAVVQCYSKDPVQRLKLKLDDLFAPIGQMPEFHDQPVSDDIKKVITNSIDAVTFQKVFAQEKLNNLPVPEKRAGEYQFYGKPTQVIDPQLFVDLPNFNEISRELLPGVKFRNYNNQPSIQVLNNPLHNYFQETPLILMDGIPIRDLNVIKNMGSTDIDRVEICQNERFYGDLRFPGVVAIYTTKADYSGLPETDQLVKLNMEAIQIPTSLKGAIAAEPSIPDLRQALYWEPSAKPEKNIPVSFRTSGVIGNFKISISGVKTDGTQFCSEKQFEVK